MNQEFALRILARAVAEKPLAQVRALWRTGYVLGEVAGHPVIVCVRCLMTSAHVGDIDERYCGRCHVFHADRPKLDEEAEAREVLDWVRRLGVEAYL